MSQTYLTIVKTSPDIIEEIMKEPGYVFMGPPASTVDETLTKKFRDKISQYLDT